MKTIIILFIVVLFYSCSKKNDADAPQYTISGRIFENCSLQPSANLDLEFIQGGSGRLGSTTTDSNGYFKFDYKDLSGQEIKIHYSAGAGFNDLITNLPAKQVLSDMTLYLHPTTNIQVSLNVTNPHTANDTLLIKDFYTGQGIVPGPFHSGVIYTANNINPLGMIYGQNNNYINWSFRPFNGLFYIKHFTLDKYCNDTVFVTVDIN